MLEFEILFDMTKNQKKIKILKIFLFKIDKMYVNAYNNHFDHILGITYICANLSVICIPNYK